MSANVNGESGEFSLVREWENSELSHVPWETRYSDRVNRYIAFSVNLLFPLDKGGVSKGLEVFIQGENLEHFLLHLLTKKRETLCLHIAQYSDN